MKDTTREFLLEVGVEEMPAWMIPSALADLKRLLTEGLGKFGLTKEKPAALEVYATPRRLVGYCRELRPRQPSTTEMVFGPPKRVAFDPSGQPTVALKGFMEKIGASLNDIVIHSTPKGEYVVFHKHHAGSPTEKILQELIPQAILAIYFPRTMYWEGKAGPYFIRPIRWLLALYAGKVIPCSVGTVRAGKWTCGHRQLGKERLSVKDFAQYQDTLRKNFVLLDPEERRARILEQAEGLLRAEGDFRMRTHPDLLDTHAYLTEFPTPLVGAFDRAFLSLPEEVLVTVMRGHQKYFAVEQHDGRMAPLFVAVMETDQDRSGAIRHGHERVLRARFNDAKFFWETDARTPLAQRLERLKDVTFQSQLGSYYDKAMRMQEFANHFVRRLEDAGSPVPPEMHPPILEAAKLAKCDLTTDLVKEFTELQGVVGGLYARREGLPEEVSAAIYDHYRPQTMEDSLPRSLAGDVVSLADRLDTLVGCFGVGLPPSGSKDPFGLRRAAQGVIRILAEHRLRLTLHALVDAGCEVYALAQRMGQLPAWNESAARQPLADFLEERLRYYLREVRGFAYDEVNAVLAAGKEDVADVLARLKAVARIRPTEHFEPLAASFKRMKNILRQARQSYGYTNGQLRHDLLEPGPELQLYETYLHVVERVQREKRAGNFFAALEAIASLRPDVDRFFDTILVMAKEADVRNNRLSLLDALLSEFSTIADFSEIVPKESEPRP